MEAAEQYYFQMLELGAKPEEARSILPNSLKTEIVMTMNISEWRHYFRLRRANAAQPQRNILCSKAIWLRKKENKKR